MRIPLISFVVVFFHITIEIKGDHQFLPYLPILADDNITSIIDGNALLSDYPNNVPSLVKNPNVRSTTQNQNYRFRKDDDCSDELLRKVMHEHMSETGMSESKRAIHNAAKRDFEGRWSIVCAPCAFSYLAHTQEFCIHSRYGITCLLYRDA